jgi:hypothetical protein
MLRPLLCDVIRQAKDRKGYSYLRTQTMLSGNRKAGAPEIRTLARLVRTPAASVEGDPYADCRRGLLFLCLPATPKDVKQQRAEPSCVSPDTKALARGRDTKELTFVGTL